MAQACANGRFRQQFGRGGLARRGTSLNPNHCVCRLRARCSSWRHICTADTLYAERLRLSSLTRINEGTFGECLNCGQEINAKRLEAIPWVRYCITCQELIDGTKEK